MVSSGTESPGGGGTGPELTCAVVTRAKESPCFVDRYGHGALACLMVGLALAGLHDAASWRLPGRSRCLVAMCNTCLPLVQMKHGSSALSGGCRNGQLLLPERQGSADDKIGLSRQARQQPRGLTGPDPTRWALRTACRQDRNTLRRIKATYGRDYPYTVIISGTMASSMPLQQHERELRSNKSTEPDFPTRTGPTPRVPFLT